ncbi:MAG: hypothetical protein HKN45_04305 [Flavobacteriales bacterium]|nr:hypothetical protein [Flavobacteriales bacterium]
MDPLGGVRSSMAQGKALTKGVKSKVKMAKGLKAKSAKLNKPVVKYLLVFLLISIFLGLSVFVPLHGFEGISRVRLTFVGMSLIAIILGSWHVRRMEDKIDWAHPFRLGPELLLTVGVALILFLGVFLIFYFLPRLMPNLLIGRPDFAAIIGSSSLFFIVPVLVDRLFKHAQMIDPKQYRMWYYPKEYIEKQPTWSREKLVYANLIFNLKRTDDRHKRIEVRLPLEANFGEMIYLFINDFNENKQPDDPIKDLRSDNDSLGWLFSVPKSIWKLKVGKRYLDPELTVEENEIEKQMNITFERTYKDLTQDE